MYIIVNLWSGDEDQQDIMAVFLFNVCSLVSVSNSRPSALKKMKLEVPSFAPLEATTSSQSLSLLGR